MQDLRGGETGMKDTFKVRAGIKTIKNDHLSPGSLKTGRYPSNHGRFQREDAIRVRRVAKKSRDTFEVTANPDGQLELMLGAGEIRADGLVNYRGIIVVDNDDEVIQGHEKLALAVSRGDRLVPVIKFLDELTLAEVEMIRFRYDEREARLEPMDRIEAIGQMVDKHQIGFEEIRALCPRGRKSLKEIRSDYETWKIYRDRPGYRLPFSGFQLDSRCFSNLKFLVGHPGIGPLMEREEEVKELFIAEAIKNSQMGKSRIHDDFRKVWDQPDTQQTLLDRGLTPALEEYKAKHPEEDTSRHPHYDILAITKKLRMPDTRILQHQLERNPARNETWNLFKDALLQFMNLAPSVETDLLQFLSSVASEGGGKANEARA